jgi:type III secretory pathway component EscS
VPVELGALQDRLKALQFRFFGSEFLETLSLLRDQEMRPVYDFVGPAECGYHIAGLHGRGELLLYSWKSTLVILALSWLGSWLAAGAGVLVSLQAATVRQAQQVLMLAIMLLLFVPVYGVKLLPGEWRAQIDGTLAAGGAARLVLVIIAALTVVDTSLIIAAMARFRRARLILKD